MKKIIYIYGLVLLIMSSACNNDYLDEPPLNVLSKDQVFSSEQGIDSYITALYINLPIEDFNYSSNSGFNNFPTKDFLALSTDEMSSAYFIRDNNNQIEDGTGLGWYSEGYSSIRNAMDFINNLENSNAITQARKTEVIAEAKWMLAFDYFALVKRYGGIPIIKEIQNFTGDNLSELQIPRNKEKEVWDYVLSLLDDSIKNLPESNSETNKYRANKYVALALKSRVALYAACIAKYGDEGLNGLIGIPKSESAKYFQLSSDASQAIINSGIYSLYKKNPDKSKNYAEYFFSKEDEKETIFQKSYKYPSLTHNFDNWALPSGYVGYAGYGSGYCPTLNFVEKFEYLDGSEGSLKIKSANGDPVYYHNTLDIFTNKDPRLSGTVMLPGSLWENQKSPGIIEVRAGVSYKGKLITSNNKQDEVTFDDGVSMKIIGKSGIIDGYAEETPTGFYIRKFLDPNPSSPDKWYNTWWSDVPWKEFRYAEILLNLAESQFELGNIASSLVPINEIRNRAGIITLNSNEITLDKIRHERNIELAYENKTYWDYIRWRIFDKKINNYSESALIPYYSKEEDAYFFEERYVPGPVKNFNSRAYYQRIEPSEINKNPNLIQNPGY